MKWLIVIVVVAAIVAVLALRMRRSGSASGGARRSSGRTVPPRQRPASADIAGEEFVSDTHAPSASETPGSPVDIERRPRG